MLAQEINFRLKKARKTLYSKGSLPYHYEAAIKSVRYVGSFLEREDLRAYDILAKLYYKMGRYLESRNQYDRMLDVDSNNLKAIHGLFKLNVLDGRLEVALVNLIQLKQLNIEVGIMIETSFLERLLRYALGEELELLTYFQRYLSVDITDDELQSLLNALVDSINDRDINKAIELVQSCKEITERKDIGIDFLTLEVLLEYISKRFEVEQKSNLKDSYEELKTALYNKDEGKIIELLEIIKLYPLIDEYSVLRALFFLIMRNHLEIVTGYVEKMAFSCASKDNLNVLNQIINEQRLVNNLTEEQLKVYYEAIEKGREAYRAYDLSRAYDYYLWAFSVTSAPIFLYYIGKMLYKMQDYKKAKASLLDYIAVGGMKVEKAYLYLFKICEKTKKRSEARKYAEKVDEYNMLFCSEYESLFSTYPDQDTRKIRLQSCCRYVDIFDNQYTARVQEFRTLYESGRVNEANARLLALEKKEEKTKEDKVVLAIVKRNKTLFKR